MLHLKLSCRFYHMDQSLFPHRPTLVLVYLGIYLPSLHQNKLHLDNNLLVYNCTYRTSVCQWTLITPLHRGLTLLSIVCTLTVKGGEDHLQHQHILKIFRNIRPVYLIDETACDEPTPVLKIHIFDNRCLRTLMSTAPSHCNVPAKFRARYCSAQFKWDLYLISLYFHMVVFLNNSSKTCLEKFQHIFQYLVLSTFLKKRLPTVVYIHSSFYYKTGRSVV